MRVARRPSSPHVEKEPGLKFLVGFVAVLLCVAVGGFLVLANIQGVIQSDLPLHASVRPDAGVILAAALWMLLIVVVLLVGVGVAVGTMKRL